MYICEFLPRLNSISVNVEFNGEVSDITKVNITGGVLSIIGKEKYEIILPIEGDFELSSIRKSSQLLNLSLKNQSSTIKTDNFMLTDLQWSCKDLLKTPKIDNKNCFKFICKQCEEVIVDSDNRFNDMPSELWAELMDLWHCHKPHNHDKHSKNYNGNLVPRDNQVIIGSYYLLANVPNVCKCGLTLGEIEASHSKLMKWNLKLVYNDTVEDYPQYYYIYNKILDKINLSAVRKVVIGKYLVWIFNLGIDISVEQQILSKSLKICYSEYQDKPIDEEIILNDEMLEVFYKEINRVHEKLPVNINSMLLKEDDRPVMYKISYLGLQ
ncbi:hypothetical protein CLIB1444_01S05512 [[Candida] jaroonii]|uniref:Uncharacterized protein n=1 Tax=[Candida] jaroonii TaxID=467808 RepID=A0ACA9Y0D4_9ASCO|nr:hypothetical protein CLIB1444_01S05512 [[Candida] jaroonii]